MGKGFLDIDCEKVKEGIIAFIRQNVIESGRQGVLIGLSGGLDSALVIVLCTLAVGSRNVCAVMLPERDSDPSRLRDAQMLSRSLQVRIIQKKIASLLFLSGACRSFFPTSSSRRETVRQYVLEKRKKLVRLLRPDTHQQNPQEALRRTWPSNGIKNRVRTALLCSYAERLDYLYVGSLNKSEHLTGLFVPYGDSIADIMPIICLYKSQVFMLAHHLRLPASILQKRADQDLVPGGPGEDLLGLSYDHMDRILCGMERGMSFDEMVSCFQVSEEQIERVFAMVRDSEKLRSGPVFCKIRDLE